jgi:hypothetical protein
LFSDDPNSHADGDLVQLLHPLRAAAASTASDIGATPGAEAAAAPADAREASLRAMIRALSAGTWLEFVTDASGRTARRKLARLNPANGRTLLVNLRGAKIAEHSVETLARAIVRGHARVLAADDLALA